MLWHNPYSHRRDAPNLNVNIIRSRFLEQNPWPRYHPSLLSAHHLKNPSEICLKAKLKAAILENFGHGTTIKIWKCTEAVDMFVEGLTVPTIEHRVSEIRLLPNHLFRKEVCQVKPSDLRIPPFTETSTLILLRYLPKLPALNATMTLSPFCFIACVSLAPGIPM